MQNLVIVESPAKAKTISRFLGKKYKVEASAGHLRDLPVSKMAIDIENNFDGEYVMVANLPYYITTPIIFKFLEMDFACLILEYFSWGSNSSNGLGSIIP